MEGQEDRKDILSRHLLSQMYVFWQNEQLCDIRLQIQNSTIPAHRVVLAALSPYFRAMFCSQLTESQQSTVAIQGLSAEVVHIIVEYAYTAAVQLNEENVQHVLQAASIMQIESLEHLCTSFLTEHLHPSNCLGIRDLAHLLGCSDLYTNADRFCQDNFFEMSKSDEFLHLSASQVINLVARDALKVRKEEDVYTAVIQWFEYAPEKRTEDMVKIMEKVRLPLLQWKFLMGKVSKHKLFTNNEQCHQYLQEARAFQASSFHPDLNSFAFTEAVYLAQPRLGFRATDCLHAVGGETTDRELLSAVEAYNPVTGQTNLLSPIPTPRRSLGVVVMDNVIFAIGGSNGKMAVSVVEAYNIEEDRWKTIASLCEPRTSVSAAVFQGQIYAVGGHDGQRALSSVEVYDSDINCWSHTSGKLQVHRSMASMVSLRTHLFVLGGYDGVSDLQSAERMDSTMTRWVPIASMHETRSMSDAVAVDTQIIVVGGNSGSRCLSSMEMYDPSTDQWTLLQSLNVPRRGLGMAVMGDTLYVAGGNDGKGYLKSVEAFNKGTKEWTIVGNLGNCRGRFGFV